MSLLKEEDMSLNYDEELEMDHKNLERLRNTKSRFY